MSSKRETRCDDTDLATGRVGRADFATLPRIDKLERTPTGGIRVPARVSRTGVLTYLRADGSTFAEYRPEEEAFAPASLASLEDAVVTVGHPPNSLITAQTAKQYSVGHVRGPGKRDDRFVGAELAVLDAFAIDSIASATLAELSSGYTCRLEMTPGLAPDGTRYDAVQRDVIYNHVALLPVGAGRAGRDVALRLDGVEVRLESAPQPTNPQPRTDAMEEIINGKKYIVGSAEWWAAHTRRIDEMEAAAASGEEEKKSFKQKFDELVKARDAMQAQLDSANAEIEQLKKDMGEGEDEEKMDALVNERLGVLTVASQVLGADHKPAGKSNDALRREVITKLDGAAVLAGSDGKPKSADYVRAYYESAARRAAGTPSVAQRADSVPAPTGGPRRLASPSALRSATPWDLRNR